MTFSFPSHKHQFLTSYNVIFNTHMYVRTCMRVHTHTHTHTHMRTPQKQQFKAKLQGLLYFSVLTTQDRCYSLSLRCPFDEGAAIYICCIITATSTNNLTSLFGECAWNRPTQCVSLVRMLNTDQQTDVWDSGIFNGSRDFVSTVATY